MENSARSFKYPGRMRRVRSIGAVAAPDPDEGVGESSLENARVAVAGRLAEDEALRIAFGLERGGGALAGHDPVVIRFLRVVGSVVLLGDMSEDAQRFHFARFDELHAGVV